MKIKPVTEISAALRNLRASDWEKMTPLYTLALCPEYAEPGEIRQVLHELLYHKKPAVRRHAALVLHKIGDPQGIVHLTYSILSKHPVLKTSQTNDYHDLGFVAQQVLLPYAEMLTKECVEMLFDDLLGENGKYHLDILACAPFQYVEPLANKGLNKGKLMGVYCAYLLARNRHDDGLSVLMKCLENGWHIELGLIGLSHIGNSSHAVAMERYLDPALPIYNQHQNLFGFLHRLCELRRELLILPKANRLISVLEQYSLDQVQIDSNGGQTEIFSFGNRARGVLDKFGSTVDLIEEFATLEEKQVLYQRQRKSAASVLNEASFENPRVLKLTPYYLDMPIQKPSFYYPEIEVTFDRNDLLTAASEWLLNPERHRFGQYHGPYANYSDQENRK